MAKGTHKSAKGKNVDLAKLKLRNEHVIAAGNKNVNARGDLLGPGGAVIKTRDELNKEKYGVPEAQPNTHKGK